MIFFTIEFDKKNSMFFYFNDISINKNHNKSDNEKIVLLFFRSIFENSNQSTDLFLHQLIIKQIHR